MIDIHTHILPGVDDGAADTGEAMRMLQLAADSGVRTLVLTPHCNVPGSYENYDGPRLQERFSRLKQRVSEQGIPIRLLPGQEVRMTEKVPQLLKEGKIFTINRSRYLLAEFDFRESGIWCRSRLEEILDLGYIPVIAHPERYYFVWEQPWIVYDWLEMGCHLQVTKGSILGRFGRQVRQTSEYLLDHDLVACVASDAHSYYQRTPYMEEIYRYLSETYSVSYAELLLKKNPAKICENDVL